MVQDEITDAIVRSIEPEIYAAENYHGRRKPPNSVDAWDPVMRALSHHWRLTRPDTILAQALLKRRIAIDPHYGQALPLFATSHMAGAHLGWASIAHGGPIAERSGACGDHRRPRCSGAQRARQRPLTYAASTICWPSLNWRCNSIRIFRWRSAYYGLALSYCGRWQEGYDATQRAIRLSPRDPFSAIYYGVAAYAQFVGRNYEEAIALSREAIRHAAI